MPYLLLSFRLGRGENPEYRFVFEPAVYFDDYGLITEIDDTQIDYGSI